MNKCSVKDCTGTVKYKGLCGKHYKRQWRHGNPETTLIIMDANERGFCVAPECQLRVKYPATGLCHIHHIRMSRYGRFERERAVFGEGRPLTAAGYVLLTRDGKRVYEHIYLAEQALGKPLPGKAIVHHMNEDPADNFTPLNLVICPDQAYHMLLHRRMEEYKKFGKCLTL